MRRARYALTARAAANLREARAWSRTRWGRELTDRYFQDLHQTALFLAENQHAARRWPDPQAGTAPFVHAVREHYLVYEPIGEQYIAIVAVIRQGRDLPAILSRWSVEIQRSLAAIRTQMPRGEIRPAARAPARKKN